MDGTAGQRSMVLTSDDYFDVEFDFNSLLYVLDNLDVERVLSYQVKVYFHLTSRWRIREAENYESAPSLRALAWQFPRYQYCATRCLSVYVPTIRSIHSNDIYQIRKIWDKARQFDLMAGPDFSFTLFYTLCLSTIDTEAEPLFFFFHIPIFRYQHHVYIRFRSMDYGL